MFENANENSWEDCDENPREFMNVRNEPADFGMIPRDTGKTIRDLTEKEMLEQGIDSPILLKMGRENQAKIDAENSKNAPDPKVTAIEEQIQTLLQQVTSLTNELKAIKEHPIKKYEGSTSLDKGAITTSHTKRIQWKPWHDQFIAECREEGKSYKEIVSEIKSTFGIDTTANTVMIRASRNNKPAKQ